MSAQAGNSQVSLESVISTDELNRGPARQPEHAAVTAALVTLVQTIANAPERILQKFQGKSFLKFLLSLEKDVDAFRASKRKKIAIAVGPKAP
jgi:hypothetical protein